MAWRDGLACSIGEIWRNSGKWPESRGSVSAVEGSQRTAEQQVGIRKQAAGSRKHAAESMQHERMCLN